MADPVARPAPESLPAEVDEIRALERIGRRAWPPRECRSIDGWVAGVGDGYTRRANSVVAAAGGSMSFEDRLAQVEQFYAERGLRACFKSTRADLPGDLAARLAARGYRRGGHTRVLVAEVESLLALPGPPEPVSDEGLIFDVWRDRLDPGWLADARRLSGIARAQAEASTALLARVIERERGVLFAGALQADRFVSVAAGSLVEDVVSIALVGTEEGLRGHRLAERVMRSILYAARDRDANRALLSVEVANTSARRLYGRMGFGDRYDYAYYVQPRG